MDHKLKVKRKCNPNRLSLLENIEPPRNQITQTVNGKRIVEPINLKAEIDSDKNLRIYGAPPKTFTYYALVSKKEGWLINKSSPVHIALSLAGLYALRMVFILFSNIFEVV